ncbi:MAG: hypothetical protein ACI4RA_09030 [Kiritimatiellia bacterium]
MIRRLIALVCSLALAAGAVGGVADPFYVNFNPSWRTAYQTRSRIIEDRPMFMTLTRAGFDSKEHGDFGKLGIWHWNVSSLSGRRDAYHRRPLNEMDYGLFWTYTWDFGQYSDAWKGWGLTTDFIKDWITLEGYTHPYREAKTNASINEWRIEQSLNNPYATPFCLLRRSSHPTDWFYARIGIRRKFTLTDALAFTPEFFTENGNEWLFERRYGAQPGGDRYRAGLMTLNLILELSWKVSEMTTVYANVQQFDVVHDDARAAIKARKTANSRRDLTIGTLGLRFRF